VPLISIRLRLTTHGVTGHGLTARCLDARLLCLSQSEEMISQVRWHDDSHAHEEACGSKTDDACKLESGREVLDRFLHRRLLVDEQILEDGASKPQQEASDGCSQSRVASVSRQGRGRCTMRMRIQAWLARTRLKRCPGHPEHLLEERVHAAVARRRANGGGGRSGLDVARCEDHEAQQDEHGRLA
jgi:hypothetical protein